ncbi:MAG: family 43 glycosylhydrolase [Lachnospiraceae bacterium]|nr:family 43 glycosylhydrolase [Lachnospiraceae bacterium]
MRKGWLAASCALIGMALSAGSVTAQEAENWFTESELVAHEYLLYQVNCGAGEELPADLGELGLMQSAWDQELAADAVTGYRWGYEARMDIKAVADDLGEGLTAWKWEIDDTVEYNAEETGFYYHFELPEGGYEVTCGFYNPFNVKKIDIFSEDIQVVSAEKILKYKQKEFTFEQTVTDGTLDLKICNTNRNKDAMQNPILSYIIVKAQPDYDQELVECLLEQTEPGADAADIYTTASLTVLTQAREDAAAAIVLALQKSEAEAKELYKNAYQTLQEAYNAMEERNVYSSFKPGTVWTDTENRLIQAHGGHVQKLTVPDKETGEPVEKWWWVGEDKTLGYRGGICAYSSDDLYNWEFEGVVMRNVNSREQLKTEEYFTGLYGDYSKEQLDNVYMCINDTTSVIERPKMIYNEKTGMYVIWFHADGPTEGNNSNYAAASAGVAVSESPYGPFRFIDRYRLNTCPEDQEDMYPQSKGMARDMNLFVDDDGTAYIIYSSEENLTLYISKLNEEYTYLATDPAEAVYGEDYIRLFPGAQREAPALLKKDGTYYLITSGCTGWSPNPSRYYMAEELLGEWKEMGDPFTNDTDGTSCRSQSTCLFLADEETETYIYMGDRWNADDLTNSRYIWLPLDFAEDGTMSITYVDEWKLP